MLWCGAILIALMAAAHPRSLEGPKISVSSSDTRLELEAGPDRITVVSLTDLGSGREWIGEGEPLRLIASVSVNGSDVPLQWRLADHTDSTLTFVNDDPPLELQSLLRAFPGPGPVEHVMRILNRGDVSVLLPGQASLSLAAHAPGGTLTVTSVPKGGGAPSPAGVHTDAIGAGYSADLESTPYADGDHDLIPWLAVQDGNAKQGWYAGIESSAIVRVELQAASPDTLHAILGIDGRAPFATRLVPGEAFEAPVVFVGCFDGSLDDGANRLHRWVESHLRPPAGDAPVPLLVNDTWGSATDVSDALARQMIDDAAGLGFDMFHLDAGWYRGVGDWRPDPAKFPQGIGAIADFAHAKGLRFGLWMAWTQGGGSEDACGPGACLDVADPSMTDWFTQDYPAGWEAGPFTGAQVCLGDTAAVTWSLNTLDDLVSRYRIDMLEHDQRVIAKECDQFDHLHTAAAADIAYRAARGYAEVYDALRAEHPGLLFEDCSDGGHLVDYAVLRRTHYVSITDAFDPLSNRQAFYDASYALPPSMCECYVAEDPGQSLDDFRTMLRSGMMGWCTIMADMGQWSPTQRATARRQFQIYREVLRPLIAAADIHHVEERPDGVRWDGIQYADPSTGNGVLFAFRGSTSETRHVYHLTELDPDASYSVASEDGGVLLQPRTGRELMDDGVAVDREEPGTSDIVYVQQGGLHIPPSTPSTETPLSITPNPFHGQMAIDFSLKEEGEVSLVIYDLGGRVVRTLQHGRLPASDQVRDWDGRTDRGGVAGPGVYFLRLVTPEGIMERRAVRLE